MRNNFILGIILGILISCSSPQKAFDAGDYDKATRIALREYKKDKNKAQNINILQESAKAKVELAISENSDYVSSSKVSLWKKSQTNYYKVLEDVGETNKKTDGQLAKPYDQLCELKNDLDFKIVEHYYTAGIDLLDQSKSTGKTLPARDAYFEFVDAEKNGGEKFYQDIKDKKEKSIELGTIYYRLEGNVHLGNDIFLEELPLNAERKPDCIVDVRMGHISSTESRKESRDKLEEEVEVGQTAITDTSGKVTYEPIMQTITGTEVTTTITVTMSTHTRIAVENVTGECYLNSKTFRTEISDDYDEVIYEGDARTWPMGASNKTGEPSFFRSKLERKLKDKVKNEL